MIRGTWMLGAALLGGTAGSAAAQNVIAGAAPVPPAVDGVLSEPFWLRAGTAELAWEWYPGDNTPAPVSTRCHVAADADALYVGCRASDSAGGLRARYQARDRGTDDDHIALTIDPFGERREGFVFIVSAAGVQSDALFSEQTGRDVDWDALWDAAATVDSAGYTVELAIPFRSIRLPATPGAWRLVIERHRPRQTDRTLGAFALDRDDACLLCQSLVLLGVAPGGGGQGITLQPSLTAAREELREGDERFADEAAEAGLSVRWNPSATARVSATLNPDFSQLEADELEFEINRRFAISFPEKRPFFLEGRELLGVYGDLVFTRTVVDPAFGAKATARLGPASAAGFVARDRINSVIVPGPLGSRRVSLDEPVVTAVARGRAFVGADGIVGATLTAREGAGYHNRVAAVDVALRPGGGHRIRAVLAASDSRYPAAVAAESGRGLMMQARYDFEARRWGLEAGYRYVGSEFRADAGLLQRVDVRGPEVQARHIMRADAGRWFNRIDLVLEAQRLTDLRGRLIDGKAAVGVEYAGPFGSEAELELARRNAAVGSQSFVLETVEAEVSLRPAAPLVLALELLAGGEVDADNLREADLVSAGIAADGRIGRRIAVSARFRDERLTLEGERIYHARIGAAGVEYHFGLRTQLRGLLQLRSTRRNPALHVDPVEPRERTLAGQLVFSYRAGVRTSVFAGYSGLGESEGGATTAQRHTLFVKVAYDLSL